MLNQKEELRKHLDLIENYDQFIIRAAKQTGPSRCGWQVRTHLDFFMGLQVLVAEREWYQLTLILDPDVPEIKCTLAHSASADYIGGEQGARSYAHLPFPFGLLLRLMLQHSRRGSGTKTRYLTSTKTWPTLTIQSH